MKTKLDAYSVMGFPARLDLDESKVRERFQVLSKSLHPDAGGDAAAYQRLVEAQHILSNTARRLRHWAELAGWKAGAAVMAMDASTGGSFARVAGVIKSAKEARTAKEKADSALAKAMADCRCLEAQDALSNLLVELERTEDEAKKELRALSDNPPEAGSVARLAARFSYLDKWKKEAREALARLA